MYKNGTLGFLVLLSLVAFGQSAETLRIRDYRVQQEHRWLKEYQAFLAIPNLASDKWNMEKNAQAIMQMMQARGIGNLQLLKAKTAGIAPAVYGEVLHPGAKQTIIFYAHYDGQPADSTKWFKGLHPFKPTLLNGSLEQQAVPIPWPSEQEPINPDWRIYARGASDDKAGVMSILSAYEAIVATGMKTPYNLKFFLREKKKQARNICLKFCKIIRHC